MPTLEAYPLTVPFSDIPAIPTDWACERLGLAYGTPALWAAPGGTGKGLAICKVISLFTTGARFPGEPEGTTHEPRSCIYIAPEDDPNEVVAYRLKAAGADMRYVNDMSILPGDDPFTWPACKAQLRQAIAAINEQAAKHPDPYDPEHVPPVGFVAIDPLHRVLEKPLSNPMQASRVWLPLSSIAREYHLAMVVSHHTVKSGAVAGTKSLTDAARVVFLINRDKDELQPRKRDMTVFKANGIDDSVATVFDIVGEGTESRVEFREPVTASQDSDSVLRVVRRQEPLSVPLPPPYSGGSQDPTVPLQSPPATFWRTLRRYTGADGMAAPALTLQPDQLTREAAYDAASRDTYAAGHSLAWQEQSGCISTTVLKLADGGMASYAVYPVAP